MWELRRRKGRESMPKFRKGRAVLLKLFLILASCRSLVVSCASNNSVLEIYKPNSSTEQSAVVEKSLSHCQCDDQGCVSEGTHFKIIRVPRSSCSNTLADLVATPLCPAGMQAAAIASEVQMKALVDCLLCGTSTEFARSRMKYPVLTSGRVRGHSPHAKPMSPRDALRESGVWSGHSLDKMKIDASIPVEVSSFTNDQIFGPEEPLDEGSYMVFLEGNNELQCEQASEDGAGSLHFSTYQFWTLYSHSTLCTDISPDMYILCQEIEPNRPITTPLATTSTASAAPVPSLHHQHTVTSRTRATATIPPTKCCLLNPKCENVVSVLNLDDDDHEGNNRGVKNHNGDYHQRDSIGNSNHDVHTHDGNKYLGKKRSNIVNQSSDTVPCSKNESPEEDIVVCPGEEAVIACHPDYVGNITVICDERTLALATASNTCTLAWIGEVHQMIENGSFSGTEIAREINDNITNITLTMNDLSALSEELAALEMLEKSQLEEISDSEQRVQIALNYTQELEYVVSNLLSTGSTWDNLNDDEAAAIGPEFLESAERSGFLLADQVSLPSAIEATQEEVRLFNISSPQLFMVVTVANRFKDASLSFAYKSFNNKTTVSLVPGFALDVADDGVSPLKIVTLFVSQWVSRRPLPGTRNEIPGGSARDVNTEIASVSIGSPDDKINFSPSHSVKLHFLYTDEEFGPSYHNLHQAEPSDGGPTPVIKSGLCVYWDTKNNLWSSDGCSMVSWQRDQSVCSCGHLTMIAVITDVHDYVGRDFALDVLGSVVVTFSLLSLLLALTIFQLSRLQSLRVRITKQLCFALGLSQLLMMLLLDPDILQLEQRVCEAAAALLHFTTLSALFWMLAEGIHLLQILHTDVDTHNKHFFALFWFGSYGSSATIVLTTAAVAVSSGESVSAAYAGPDTEYCWLNTEDGYIWAFTGPLIVVMVVNFVTHVLALHSAASLVINRRRSVPNKIKVWIKGSASLSAILGLTWVCGLMYMTTTHVMAYVFTVLTGSQGVLILVFHCLTNETVMTAFLDSLPGRLSMKLSKVVKTTQNSRYKRSCSVSPDSSIRSRTAQGKTNEAFERTEEQDNFKTQHKNSFCSQRDIYTIGSSSSFPEGPKPPLEVRFSVNEDSPAEQRRNTRCQRDFPSNWNEGRRYSEASRGTKISVLSEVSTRRSSSTSNSSLESFACSCTSDYASESAASTVVDSILTLGDVPLSTLFEYDFMT